MNADLVLAADIGGTNTRLLLTHSSLQSFTPIHQADYPSGDYPDLEIILQDFLARTSARPERACLAVAGPITETGTSRQAHVTNLPWVLDSQSLSRSLGIHTIALINDFAAVAQAIPALAAVDTLTLQAGIPDSDAPRAILGAGTGLGQALLIPDATDFRVVATEGGHVDFAPQTEEQWALLVYLQRLYGHVSYERILSGAGLVALYEFLHQRGDGQAIHLLSAARSGRDPAAIISQAALQAQDALAVRALQLFVTIYGAQAGNLALNCLPYGGLYIAGGIAPKLRTLMCEGGFLDAFNAKGRMAKLTQRVPVRLIVHPAPGLLGAARVASRL